jgi:hypothetical protein
LLTDSLLRAAEEEAASVAEASKLPLEGLKYTELEKRLRPGISLEWLLASTIPRERMILSDS